VKRYDIILVINGDYFLFVLWGIPMNGKNLKKKMKSISFRLPLLVILSSILIMLSIIPTIYFRVKNDMIEDYSSLGRGITNFMASDVDGDKVDEYISKNFEMDEYNQIIDNFHRLKENYPDVLYVYVYRYTKDGATVVIDIDSENGKLDADPPGTVLPIDEATLPYIDDFCAGRQTPAILGNTADGYLLSYEAPVFDSNGNYQCHVGIDFSMAKIKKQSLKMVASILTVIYVIMFMIMVFDVLMIKKRIIGPINSIAKCTHKFSYTTAKERMRNIQLMENLNINTGDEIEELYSDFLSVLKESVYYITNYGKAKLDIQDKEKTIGEIRQVAYMDSLTGLGNKAGLIKDTEQLKSDIASGNATFAVVMFDVNNLKYVNDTFGHEAGDAYIKNCSAMMSSEYSNSQVYRLGGDEFVVVLTGDEYVKRNEHYLRITKAFIKSYEQPDKEPFERYSASVGMSDYRQGDESFEQVLKRADEAMYEYKVKFKEKHGSYR